MVMILNKEKLKLNWFKNFQTKIFKPQHIQGHCASNKSITFNNYIERINQNELDLRQ